jgi:hypothetical protein
MIASIVFLSFLAMCFAGYGDEVVGEDMQVYPSYEERVLHHATNLARIGNKRFDFYSYNAINY